MLIHHHQLLAWGALVAMTLWHASPAMGMFAVPTTTTHQHGHVGGTDRINGHSSHRFDLLPHDRFQKWRAHAGFAPLADASLSLQNDEDLMCEMTGGNVFLDHEPEFDFDLFDFMRTVPDDEVRLLIRAALHPANSWDDIGDALYMRGTRAYLMYVSLVQAGLLPRELVRPGLFWTREQSSQLHEHTRSLPESERGQVLSQYETEDMPLSFRLICAQQGHRTPIECQIQLIMGLLAVEIPILRTYATLFNYAQWRTEVCPALTHGEPAGVAPGELVKMRHIRRLKTRMCILFKQHTIA
jgi:hypothetical protein